MMKEILIYAFMFKMLLLFIVITLTLLLNKFYYEVKGKELVKGLLWCIFLGIVDIIFSICNLFWNGYILFYIYIFMLLGLLSYSVIKNKLIISKYLFTYSLLLFSFFLWGKFITNRSVSSFESYILSIVFSPICYQENVNLKSSLYVIIFLLFTTLSFNLIKIKKVKVMLIELINKIIKYIKKIFKNYFNKKQECNDKD